MEFSIILSDWDINGHKGSHCVKHDHEKNNHCKAGRRQQRTTMEISSGSDSDNAAIAACTAAVACAQMAVKEGGEKKKRGSRGMQMGGEVVCGSSGRVGRVKDRDMRGQLSCFPRRENLHQRVCYARAVRRRTSAPRKKKKLRGFFPSHLKFIVYAQI